MKQIGWILPPFHCYLTLSAKDTTSWEVQTKSLNDFAGSAWTSRPRPVGPRETEPSQCPEAMVWNPWNPPKLPGILSENLWHFQWILGIDLDLGCERSKQVETLTEPHWPLMLQHYRPTCRTGSLMTIGVDETQRHQINAIELNSCKCM